MGSFLSYELSDGIRKSEFRAKANILKLSPKDRAAYEHYKENQRYQISLLEGSIWRAQEAEEKLVIEEAKRREEEAKRKAGDAQIKAFQEQREKSLKTSSNLV